MVKIRVDGEDAISRRRGRRPRQRPRPAPCARPSSASTPRSRRCGSPTSRSASSTRKDATAATVRVLIESTDGEDAWTTVGVSTDIIEASWLALVDSIEYKLIKRHREERYKATYRRNA